MGIKIVCAKPGIGKTAYVSAKVNEAAYDYDTIEKMQEEIRSLNLAGAKLPFPKQPVFANYDLNFSKFRHKDQKCYHINPYRLGFKESHVETLFIPRYATIAITEAQKYFDARLSAKFQSWRSRWFEAHRHFNLTIYMDVQRADLIDLNIRRLAEIIEIQKMEVIKDEYGNVLKIRWYTRHFENSAFYDDYVKNANLNENYYTEETFEIDYDIFEIYDHQTCRPQFYNGYLKNPNIIQFNESKPCEESLEAYINYVKQYDDELPEDYYKSAA